MEKHWFTLYGDSFLWLKGKVGLVYNTNNKKQFLFTLSDRIKKKCQLLLQIDNLYSVELTDEDINDKEFNQWIESLISIEAGYLSHNIAFENRPVSLKPVLKIQDKKKHYILQHNNGKGGAVLQNLHELTFYINGSVHGNNAYYKQQIFPVKDCQTLDGSKMLSFISNSRNIFLCNINLVGNIFAFPDFEMLLANISDFEIQCVIHVMIQDLLDAMQRIKEIDWPKHIRFNILVDTIFDITLLQGISLPFSITAFVFSDNDYMQFSTLFEAFSTGQKIHMIPLYNKENLRFFEENVYTDRDELENIELSKNEIFMRQSLNTGKFGKLTIMPDSNVYDNVNVPPLGTIDNSPYSLVYKEFVDDGAWFNIREHAPCEDCIYQWLCPSPSNYEIVIGRSNLCHIK